MKLITEQLDDLMFVTEETDGKKSLFIEGVFLQSDVKNKNGRMYPKDILQREVNRYSKQYIYKFARHNQNKHHGIRWKRAKCFERQKRT